MKYLIAVAHTNSEWDDVSFALVELTEKHVAFLNEVQQDAKALNKKYEYTFLNIRISGDNADFFVEDDNLPQIIKDFIENPPEREWDIIELEDLPDTTRPEQVLRYGQIKISDDTVQYVTYGKHTDEEFWIDSFDLEELNKAINYEILR